MKKFNTDKTKTTINRLIQEEKRVFRLKRVLKYSKYVALIILSLFTTVYFFKDDLFSISNNDNISPITVSTNNIEPGTNKATLTLGDGSQIVLEKGASFQTSRANSNGEQINYNVNKKKTKEEISNYLTIPRGGQYHIVLSDGTEVWLNSESQLKYPVNFIEGKERQVELIYGEAYFVVTPSSENKGAKFKVLNRAQEVEVLGTEFNIKAYKDETNVYTTLVEGKVYVNIQNRKKSLEPSQQLTFNLNTNRSLIKTVDVYNEVSWKDGVFSFDGKSLKEIMKVLSRWYDIEVLFLDKTIEDKEFVGVLSKNQNIEDILSSIKNFGIIKEYRINGKTTELE